MFRRPVNARPTVAVIGKLGAGLTAAVARARRAEPRYGAAMPSTTTMPAPHLRRKAGRRGAALISHCLWAKPTVRHLRRLPSIVSPPIASSAD